LGEQMDGRADQYALAATAFHMLTGTMLFQHSNPAVVISNQLSTPPPQIGTRRPALTDLGPVFSKALEKAPDKRYATCVEFADALAQLLASVTVESGSTQATAAAIPVPRPKRQAGPPRAANQSMQAHWKIIVALVVALAVIAVVLLVVNII
jgi:serine/threonine-protein kinase